MAKASTYYQARWHSFEGSSALTVRELLSPQNLFGVSPFQIVGGDDIPVAYEQAREQAISLLEIGDFLDCKLLHLSNGERRKVMIARGVAKYPRILILDGPFVGLDCRFRERLATVIEELMGTGMIVIVATTRAEEVPTRATHLMVVREGRVVLCGEKQDVLSRVSTEEAIGGGHEVGAPRDLSVRPVRVRGAENGDPEVLVRLDGVRVCYDGKAVLQDVDWTIRRGEHWALLGANGAGKSTLLSLLSADNPQVHANRVAVLGWSPGGGESIRGMRGRIGWVSPELQLHYRTARPCLDVVCSGYFGSIGLFERPSPEQHDEAREWLVALGMTGVGDRPFDSVSDGVRRVVLLARALVVRPALLILDEPCQGVDERHRGLILDSVDWVVRTQGVTVVFVTHHQDELPTCITHVLRLAGGRVVEGGAVRAIETGA